MFTRLGLLTVRRRRLVVALSLALLVVAGVLGTSVFGRLGGSGFDDPGAESSRATDALHSLFHTGSPNVVLLVEARSASANDTTANAVDRADVAAAAEALTTELRTDRRVVDVVSYWSLGRVAPLRSKDGRAALVLARVRGDDDAAAAVGAHVGGTRGTIVVGAGGQSPVFHSVSTTIQGDLARAESVAIPVTLVLLVLVFGGLVAAGLPLLVGLASILGTFLTLWIITLFTDVSVFSINLVTGLGLGLAIDYSLFIVSRYREELRAGRTVEAAIVRAVETAGRTVAVSALTVAVSLSALLVFPLYFLRSFAYAGIGVTLVAALTSVLTLPAVLAMLGHRVDALRLWRHREPVPVGQGFWHRVSTGVMAIRYPSAWPSSPSWCCSGCPSAPSDSA